VNVVPRRPFYHISPVFYNEADMGQLNIKDEQLIAEAKELAALLGTSTTAAVREAVHERLERERRGRDRARRLRELRAFADRFAANLTGPPMTQKEVDDFLYDPGSGLPR
jgi:hypothetical protein